MGIKAKEKKVQVGDKELTVREMVLSQRDFLFGMLREYRLAEMLYRNQKENIIAKIRAGKDAAEPDSEEGKISGRTVLEALQEIIVRLGSKDLTDLVVRILNTEDNQKIAGFAEPMTEPLRIEKMDKWLRNNLLWSQEPLVIEAILETNDLGETLKNYLKIGQILEGLFRSQKPSPESPQESARTPN